MVTFYLSSVRQIHDLHKLQEQITNNIAQFYFVDCVDGNQKLPEIEVQWLSTIVSKQICNRRKWCSFSGRGIDTVFRLRLCRGGTQPLYKAM